MTEFLEDEQLVERAKGAGEGDLRAFDELVHRHQGHVLANCRYLSGSATEAEDLAQEVLVKAYFGLRRFEGRSSFKTWIQRIKTNHCLNHIKQKRARRFVDIEEPALQSAEPLQVEPQAEKRRHAADQRAVIEQVLDDMSEALRVPLIMRDLDGLSYQDIAEALDVGLSAVKMRIKRAREEFRERYEELFEGSAPAEEAS